MLKRIIFIYTIIMSPTTLKSQDSIVFNDLTIIVTSCDKYSELYTPLFDMLLKNWPSLIEANRHVPIILVSNRENFKNPRITTINIIDEKSWSDNLLHTLEQVKTKYVLILMGDYLVHKPVNEARLKEVYMAMRQEGAGYLQISCFDQRIQVGPQHNTSGIMYKPRFQEYRTSLQAAIWNKEMLQWLLRPGESAWSFELAGTHRSDGMRDEIFLVINNNSPFEYLNAAQLGYYNPYVAKYLNDHGYNFKPKKLSIGHPLRSKKPKDFVKKYWQDFVAWYEIRSIELKNFIQSWLIA